MEKKHVITSQKIWEDHYLQHYLSAHLYVINSLIFQSKISSFKALT